MPRSTTAIRAGTRSCGRSWPRISCGCAGRRRAPMLVITSGYTQGLWLTCRALAARGATRGGGRGPVARRLVGDDPRAPGSRWSGCRWTSTAIRAGRAQRRRGAGHARAPVPDRRGALARAAAGAAGVGRDRDRGRLRLRVPLRPRAGRDAAAARAGPGGLSRHGVEDARSRAAARVGRSRRRSSARAIAGSAGRSTPAAPRSTARAYANLIASGRARPPPAPHPPRVPRAPRRARRGAAERAARRAASTGVAAGLHLLLRLPRGTDEAAVVDALAARRIRVRGLASYRAHAPRRRSRAGGRLRPPRPAGDRPPPWPRCADCAAREVVWMTASTGTALRYRPPWAPRYRPASTSDRV